MARVALKEGLLSSIDAGADPRLLASRCLDCGRHHFPAAPSCPYCAGESTVTVRLSARGTIFVHTAVEKAPPGYRGRVPYGFGVVELPEGIRIVTRLTEPRPERLRFGQPVKLVLEELCVDDAGDTVIGWAFEPEANG